MGAGSVTVAVRDDDVPGVFISETALDISEGNSAAYTVVLFTQPAGDVTVAIGGVTGTALTLDRTDLLFTDQNWDVAQEVTVMAQQDDDDDDEPQAVITHTVSSADDRDYEGIGAGSVTVTVTDDETAGVSISETGLRIVEGGSASYTVALDSQPAGDVTVAIGGVTGTDLTLDRTDLVFTDQNWNVAQEVTVTVNPDVDVEVGDELEFIVTHTVSSSGDGDYDRVNAGSVAVTVVDAATRGVTVTPTQVSRYWGERWTYTVVLDTQPTADVMVLASVPSGLLNKNRINLTFTSQNWHTPQTVTVWSEGRYSELQHSVEMLLIDHSVTGGDYSSGVSVDSVEVSLRNSHAEIDYALAAVDPVEEDVGTVRIEVVALSDLAPLFRPWSTVRLDSSGGTAIAGLDFVEVAGSQIHFDWDDFEEFVGPGGRTLYRTTEYVDVRITDDEVPEETEFFTLSLRPDPDAGLFLVPRIDVAIIDDNDEGDFVEVSFGQSTYFVATGGTVEVTVKLSEALDRAVTIPLISTFFHHSSLEVYTVPDDVTFNAGETEKSVTFESTLQYISGFGVVEDLVTLGFGATLPEGVTLAIPHETTVSIRKVGVTVTPTKATIDEGGSYAYTVVLDAPPTAQVTLDIRLPLSDDIDRSLIFTTQNWSVPQRVAWTHDQDRNTQDEKSSHGFYLTGGNYDGLGRGGTLQWFLAEVVDDDPVMDYALVAVDPVEEDAGTVRVMLEAVTNEPGVPTITYVVQVRSNDDTSEAGSDYEKVDKRLRFPAADFVEFVNDDGETRYRQTEHFDVVILDDESVEDTETLQLNLGYAFVDNHNVYCCPIFSVGSIDVSITDDEPRVEVNYGSSTYTAAEGGTVEVEVKLSAAPERTFTIPLTATGEDGADTGDYTVPMEVTFTNGETVKMVTFAATDDTVDDDGETVKLTFGDLPDDVTAGTVKETVVSITDDDVPGVTVSFGAASYTVAESDAAETQEVRENEATVTVTLSAAPEREVTIPITATGEDGATDSDYSVETEVTFGKDETEQVITFTAASDSDNDDGESVKLTFGVLPDDVTAGTVKETVVSITDDDVPDVTVEFGSSTYSVTEGEPEGVEVTVTLSEDPEQTVIIPITKMNQDGTSDSDYSGVPENVTFNRGEMVRSFIVEAVRDNLEDSGESVKLGFGTLPITVTEGTIDEATVTVTNVGAQTSLTINFGAAEYALTEGEEATITVTLNTAPGSDAIIPLIKTDRGGTTDDDYTVVKEVTFKSDETTKTITFVAKDDDVDDDDESVKLEFGDLPGGVSAGTVKETVVSITDDDEPGVEVSFDQATYSATEGGANAEIMVRLVNACSPSGGHPPDRGGPLQGYARRLGGRTGSVDLQHRRHGGVVHLGRVRRHSGRRRGDGGAGIWHPAGWIRGRLAGYRQGDPHERR